MEKMRPVSTVKADVDRHGNPTKAQEKYRLKGRPVLVSFAKAEVDTDTKSMKLETLIFMMVIMISKL